MNARLGSMTEDAVALRRSLVGAGIMAREAGTYWLTPRETRPA